MLSDLGGSMLCTLESGQPGGGGHHDDGLQGFSESVSRKRDQSNREKLRASELVAASTGGSRSFREARPLVDLVALGRRVRVRAVADDQLRLVTDEVAEVQLR